MRTLGCALAVAALLACGGVQQGAPPPLTREAATDTFHVTVEGTDTVGRERAVTELAAGDHVAIVDVAGAVTFDTVPLAGCESLVFSAGPNGLPISDYHAPQNAPCYANDLACFDPLQNDGHAGLYLKRGAALAFVGADGESFTAAEPATLALGVNDCTPGPPAPNTGAFTATVRVVRVR